MKYLILKKRPAFNENIFLEKAGARGAREDFRLPFEAESLELMDHDVAELRRDPGIEAVIPSISFTLITPVAGPPAEPAATTAWGLEAVGATSSPQDGAGVTVAVLDTGIDRIHPAFSHLAFEDRDLVDFTVDERGVAGSAPDVHGHGTHVAGTIFGRPMDAQRIGVAPGIKKALIGKVLGPLGGSTEAIHNAIDWALREGADVVSMSLGMDFPGAVTRFVQQEGLPEDIAASRALEAYRSNVRLFDRLAELVAAASARGRGALLVAASGNESRRDQDPRFTVATAPPAAADGFISVGAVSQTGDLASPFSVASFSNTGCSLAAPGVQIRSAKASGGLVNMSGTSMATPHVAGVIALWTQKLFPGTDRPKDWARDVQRAVESHVIQAPGQTRSDVGLGIVRAPQ